MTKPTADIALICVTTLLVVGMLRLPNGDIPSIDGPVTDSRESTSDQSSPSVLPADAATEHATHGASWLLAQGDPTLPILRGGPDASDLWSGQLPVHTTLTPELIKGCLAVAHDINEELGKELMQLQAKNPEGFKHRLLRMRKLVDLAVLREREPGLYKMKLFEFETDIRVRQLAVAYCQARKQGRTEELGKLMEQLQKEVLLQMGSSLAMRKDYLCRLEDLTTKLDEDLKLAQISIQDDAQQRIKDLLDCPPPVPPTGIGPDQQRKDPEIPGE